MYSLSIVTLGTPRYVIYIAESIDQHDVRVSSLVHHVADRIEEQFEYKFCMSWQMNDSYYEITAHIDASNYEYQSTFSWCKNIRDVREYLCFPTVVADQDPKVRETGLQFMSEKD